METFKLILDFGVLGVLLAVLTGLFVLVRQFAPQLIATWIAMTSTLAKLGEQVDNFGVMVIGLGAKVDATRDRASAAAQSASDAKTAVERSGSYPGVSAGPVGGYPPAPPPPRP